MKTRRLAATAAASLFCSVAFGQGKPPAAKPPAKGQTEKTAPAQQLPPPPSDAECKALPAPVSPFSFGAGETLEFDLDALGAQAGKMTMKVLPARDGTTPIEIHANTNTFFSKVRKVRGHATSYLNPKNLHPVRYVEDANENDVSKRADVKFGKDKSVKVDYAIGTAKGQKNLKYNNDGLDVGGAVYFIRQLPLKEGLSVCFDVYGIRSMWRVSGKVEEKEHVSLPVGEFEAFRISGTAVRLDHPSTRREIHVWISDDEKRLPLAALGAIDLGAVRATLTAYTRPGDKTNKAQGKETLKW